MKKTGLLIAIFLLTGCVFSKREVFYLTDKYYNMGNYISVSSSDLEKLNNESYILYTYNNFCNLPVHCENIFKNIMNKYKIDVLSIPFEEFRKTKFHKEVSYAPSVIIIKNNEVITYLDANSGSDLKKYQDASEFEQWLLKYIYLNNTTK